MKYLIFFCAIFLSQNTFAKKLYNVPGISLIDSNKFRIEGTCKTDFDLKIYDGSELITLLSYDKEFCLVYLNTFSKLLANAKKSGKRIEVNIDKLGNSKLALSAMDNNLLLNSTAVVAPSEIKRKGGAE